MDDVLGHNSGIRNPIRDVSFRPKWFQQLVPTGVPGPLRQARTNHQLGGSSPHSCGVFPDKLIPSSHPPGARGLRSHVLSFFPSSFIAGGPQSHHTVVMVRSGRRHSDNNTVDGQGKLLVAMLMAE